MTSVAELDLQHFEDAGRRLVINMTMQEDRSVEVRACEILCQGFRHRTSFQETLTTTDVFAKGFANVLDDLIGRLSGNTEIISLPTFCVQNEEVTVAGAQLISKAVDGEGVHIILRFKVFMGPLDGILQIPLQASDGTRAMSAHLAANVLSDIALPLLNLSEFMRDAESHDPKVVADLAKRMSERIPDLVFQIELLKRFSIQVDGQMLPSDLEEIAFETRDLIH